MKQRMILLLLPCAMAACSGAQIGNEGSVAKATQAAPVGIYLQAGGGQFLSAANGGGGAITATAPWMRGWEHFNVYDTAHSQLTDGDLIYLASSTGQFVSADGGGGGAITATAPWMRQWEAFYLVRLDGPGAVQSGDRVALRTDLKQDYVSAINGGGGTVLANAPWSRGWETFVITLDSAPSFTPKQRLLNLLSSISGQKTLSGVHNREPNSDPAHWTQVAFDTTGRYPALWGGDFLFEQDNIDARPTMIAEAKSEWNKGAVVDLMYHACPPTQDEACDWDGGVLSQLSDAQWSELITDGSGLNGVWKSRLDRIAIYLQDLKDSGVAVLFRPQHEMNQGAFWWGGRTGPNGTARLYQITHDYLTKNKGLDNIVWVWSVQDLSWDFDQYNPGSDYFDIASLDVYGGDGFTQDKYNAMLASAGGKPIAIGECARLPTASELVAQPRWIYFMGWAELTFSSNSSQALTSLFSAPNVLTLDEMPGWVP